MDYERLIKMLEEQRTSLNNQLMAFNPSGMEMINALSLQLTIGILIDLIENLRFDEQAKNDEKEPAPVDKESDPK